MNEYDDVCLDETYYSDIEEMQVVTEIRIGLMLGEITPSISKFKLKEWFANIQMEKREFCENITGQDLVLISRECGINVID